MGHHHARVIRALGALGLVLGLFWRTLEASPLSPQWESIANKNSIPSSLSPTATTSTFGVEGTGWPYFNTTSAATMASQISVTGARWTRISQLEWSVVQPAEGASYDWSLYDAVLAAPALAGLVPIVIVGGTPVWAAANAALPSGSIGPTHLGEFAQFVHAAVLRYGGSPYNVKHWEFFNEPDITVASYAPWISPWGNDGALYAAMLKQAYPAAKAADPSATILMGSLAYDWFTDSGGIYNRAFVDDVLNAGGGPYFDIFGFHYYANFAPVWAAYGGDILGKTNYLRGVLALHGLAAKPMAVTESGQFGVPGDATSLAAQASYVPKVNARGMSAGLVAVLWYSLIVETHDTGLLYADLTPKPAYFTYEVAAAELGSVIYTQTIRASAVQLQGPAALAFEGYLFRAPASGAYRAAVWLNSGSATMAVKASFLDRVTATGIRTHLVADQSGRVLIPVDTNPIYLELSSNPFNPVYLPFVAN